ncbi:hypothetical protein TraAM80_01217 [Trypanosoma rangeli]|uniref:Uncharacterized protein n=1 Tax=Trypanosoma rangeli TaxID=5698 RepID=A0A3R7P103_TRYRA|nr:uncharacterized protein TraAM80_01217 [Trypanosoma rangeli]RNF10952.1 hypothetical protein TraAM80_01217 [Trypanosoma rangeli]|eukprot:RNF10952.1 hypothetical protein TraAM80_01217 [Trypanosoma rangeli]
MPLPTPLSPSCGPCTREPSPITTRATPALSLRQPKCLVEYERARSLHDRKGTGGATPLVNLNVVDEEDQPPRRPNPIDKLLTYQRARAQTQQGSGDSSAMPVSCEDSPAERGMGIRKTGKLTGPVPLARLPREMTEYIMQIETQNRQLRQQVLELQEELQRRQQQTHTMMGSYQQLADAVVGNKHSVEIGVEKGKIHQHATNDLHAVFGEFLSQEEREQYVNEILAQVDVIVQAHRNQSELIILKYKQEAEDAKLALKNLRKAIALEGVDLSMLPAALATLSGPTRATRSGGYNDNDHSTGETRATNSNSPTSTEVDAAAAGIMTVMNEKCAVLVGEAADAVLGDLLRVEAGDDVPTVVRQSMQRGFEVLARHLALVVTEYIGYCTAELRYLHKERETVCRELREDLRASESRRLRMAQQHDTEIRTLRDEIHAFHVAGAEGDELKGMIHERALEEYTTLLVESRAESDSLRRQLEEERSDHATTCLRLKSSLQRRNTEFEEAVMRRAEELVRRRDAHIGELQQQLDASRRVEERRTKERVTKGVQVQAAESIILDASNYMSNVLSLGSSWKGASSQLNGRLATPTQSRSHSKAAPLPPSLPPTPSAHPPMTPSALGRNDSGLQQDNSFEEEVWAKTMELLTKYGPLSRH